ncbi:MAG: RNA 2',3'-cyclic phosphodiesterase [Deltaproteobacteria bacterium]|jgi:2'-5' RNA ligase|nr:RNA 2',3'-cyclic phosphodiesterase [Deltaproteobacteria bacterium]
MPETAPSPGPAPGSDDVLRLFVAIPVPESVSLLIRQAVAGPEELLARFPKTLHVTLSFLGNVSREMASKVEDALGGFTFPAFELRLGPLGAFSQKRGTILWAGFAPSPELSLLKARVDRALAPLPLGFQSERGPFKPHVTLARLKPGGVKAPADPRTILPAGAFAPDFFGLYSSRLDPTGAVHTLQRMFPFSAA